MIITRKQKIIIWAATILLVANCIYAPWKLYYKEPGVTFCNSIQRTWIWAPPQGGYQTVEGRRVYLTGVSIDLKTLAITSLPIIFVAFALFMTLERKRPDPTP